MRGSRKIGEGFTQRMRVWRLQDHERHARSKEDDIGGPVLHKEFVFKVSAIVDLVSLMDGNFS